jgi:hypothetical protein
MDEHNGPVLRKHEIRIAGEILAMNAKAQSHAMCRFADGDFGRSVLAPNATHHPTADFRRNNVNHTGSY